jgi:2-dehydro-3-deoxygalactonokinase
MSRVLQMSEFETTAEDLCAIYVDMGTTNTRAWLMRGTDVLAHAGKQVGVRDSARDASTMRIQIALKELIATVQEQTNETLDKAWPICVAGAGMISSPLGLAEVAHVPAPADLEALSSATRLFQFPEISALPFLLVPGVRSGASSTDFKMVGRDDVMRGEETLCVGLQALGLVEAPGVVLNLGSHWKAIQIDSHGRIQSSITSLSGELIEAVRKETILISSLAEDWPNTLSFEWVEAGMQEQRRSGLSRALFCVRLLALKNRGTPEERFSFLLGAFVASDLDPLVGCGVLVGNTQIVISGNPLIAQAWSYALGTMGIRALVATEEQTEKAFLTGLIRICAQSPVLRKSGELNWA